MDIKGIPASFGIAIGNVYLLKQKTYIPDSAPIQSGDIESEIRRFIKGRDLSVCQLEKIYTEVLAKRGEDEAELFQGYIEILTDEDMANEIVQKIRNELVNAEAAADGAVKHAIAEVEALANPYLRGRADDLRDIGRRLVCNIADKELFDSVPVLQDAAVVIGHEITPSDFAQMDVSKVVGLACEIGGITSHIAIMAKMLAIPSVVGATGITDSVSGGNLVILDGTEGTIIINPSESMLTLYRDKKQSCEQEKQHLSALADLPAVTRDGKRVELLANIGTDKDVEAAIRNGAEGIGLYRTEFLFMDRASFPTEEDQFEAYKAVAKAMKGKKVIIRTVDIGGDKALSYIEFRKEENPFLGWRAVRLYQDYPQMIRTQLRAILRASAYGCVKILFPMIISVEETQELKRIAAELKAELSREKIAFDENIEMGVMIETPAAALISDVLAKEVDFFSIGTNDLTQYTLAVDRGNNRIANLYNSLHPSVIRLIKIVADNAHAHGKVVGMCGELAGDPKAAGLLLGLGVDELSMSAIRIGKIKDTVMNISYDDATHWAQEVLKVGSSAEVSGILSGMKTSATVKGL